MLKKDLEKILKETPKEIIEKNFIAIYELVESIQSDLSSFIYSSNRGGLGEWMRETESDIRFKILDINKMK